MLQETTQGSATISVAGRRESPLSVMLRVDTPLSVVNSTEKPMQLYTRFVVGLWNLRVTAAAHSRKVEWERAVWPVTDRFSEIYKRRKLKTINNKLKFSYYPEVQEAISLAYLRLTGEMARSGLLHIDLPKDPKQVPSLLVYPNLARRRVYEPLRKISVELDALAGLRAVAETGDYKRFNGEDDIVGAVAAWNPRTIKVFRKAMRDNDELSWLFKLAIEAKEAKAILMLLAKSIRGDAFSKFFYAFLYISTLKDDELRSAIAKLLTQ